MCIIQKSHGNCSMSRSWYNSQHVLENICHCKLWGHNNKFVYMTSENFKFNSHNYIYAWEPGLWVKTGGVVGVCCGLCPGSSFSRVRCLRPKGNGARVLGWGEEVAGWQIRASVRADNDDWRNRQRRGDDTAETSNDIESKRGAGKRKTTQRQQEKRKHLKSEIIHELPVQTKRTSSLSCLKFRWPFLCSGLLFKLP